MPGAVNGYYSVDEDGNPIDVPPAGGGQMKKRWRIRMKDNEVTGRKGDTIELFEAQDDIAGGWIRGYKADGTPTMVNIEHVLDIAHLEDDAG